MAACSGPAPPPPEAPPPAPVVEAEPAPAPPTLEEDAVPEGAVCFATSECEGDQQCRGPAGCGGDWACGAPRACGEESVAYCGCDTATFYAPQNCPGQPYDHVGPCETLGEELTEAPEPVEGSRVCTRDGDCPRGFVCAGTPGCSTLWTCVRRRRMRPRCGRQTDHFCSCDSQTFEASASCPGRPFLSRGYCPGDEPPTPEEALLAQAEPPAPPTPPTPPTPPPAAPRPRPTPPATRPSPPPVSPPAAEPPLPAACVSNRDCPRGQVCSGTEGCASDWHCQRPPERCISDTQYFCGCTGETFTAPMNCPGRPHRHRGSCPRE